jgi:mRNA-degrading endonuclease RelE of RelBE toxin-antitoxin system
MIRVEYSSRFRRAYKKLPQIIKNNFEEKFKIFQFNPFYPVLNTHPLKGGLKDHCSFYLVAGYWVLLFLKPITVLC